MELKFEHGTPDTLHLALLPLKKVNAQLAASMEAAGTGKRCGVCGKPFDTVRKWRSVARVTFGGDLIMLVAWKLCGKCSHEAKRNGGKIPDSLRREAESVSKAALLAMTDTGGTA
jgi:hypothetical protein